MLDGTNTKQFFIVIYKTEATDTKYKSGNIVCFILNDIHVYKRTDRISYYDSKNELTKIRFDNQIDPFVLIKEKFL